MGGDEAVVAAARVSNGALYANASKGPDKDAGLIRFLLKNGHTSPFEHSVFTFFIDCPLFVRSEWQRHRTWSYNEISGRYTKIKQKLYLPTKLRTQHPTNKQSSIPFDDMERKEHITWLLRMHISGMRAFELYDQLLERGVAREVARIVLPLNAYTQFYGTVNAHNLMKFLILRDSDDAQWEIHEYAKVLAGFLKEKMPLTYAAFEERRAIIK
jgi:thymidylate synthase (FAD)